MRVQTADTHPHTGRAPDRINTTHPHLSTPCDGRFRCSSMDTEPRIVFFESHYYVYHSVSSRLLTPVTHTHTPRNSTAPAPASYSWAAESVRHSLGCDAQQQKICARRLNRFCFKESKLFVCTSAAALLHHSPSTVRLYVHKHHARTSPNITKMRLRSSRGLLWPAVLEKTGEKTIYGEVALFLELSLAKFRRSKSSACACLTSNGSEPPQAARQHPPCRYIQPSLPALSRLPSAFGLLWYL